MREELFSITAMRFRLGMVRILLIWYGNDLKAQFNVG
jgi:hypothetical protein